MSAPYDPNQGYGGYPPPQGYGPPPPQGYQQPLLLLPNKKRRATAAFTHVSPPSAVVGSAERHANAVLSASTAAVNRLPLKQPL
ncbi:hypothetical protein NW766_007201 [Fusarium irregulare]|uniref:Uncharacterized protein n=1 Tax=Fusarium irregulare TaxID=2494466 RepID=A0A9W8U917_9HYPO|nr:hypothetical protein NW766_007201 [Fusarium irregulare]